MTDPIDIGPVLKQVVRDGASELDKAVITLFLSGGERIACSAFEIAARLEAAGSATINRARLRSKMVRDRRAIKDGDGFRISPKFLQEVSQLVVRFTGPVRPDIVDNVLDSGLFEYAHGYVKNITDQINISYSDACFDCSAVMIRRLFEMLVIDSFENKGAIAEITDKNGDIFPLSGLISKLGSTTSFTVSRQTKQAAGYLKDVGDWSAHNRRHRARKSDIDSVIKHLRLASSDLLHLAGQDGG